MRYVRCVCVRVCVFGEMGVDERERERVREREKERERERREEGEQ